VTGNTQPFNDIVEMESELEIRMIKYVNKKNKSLQVVYTAEGKCCR